MEQTHKINHLIFLLELSHLDAFSGEGPIVRVLIYVSISFVHSDYVISTGIGLGVATYECSWLLKAIVASAAHGSQVKDMLSFITNSAKLLYQLLSNTEQLLPLVYSN